eukprot:2315400-Rhodomonas_salina.1
MARLGRVLRLLRVMKRNDKMKVRRRWHTLFAILEVSATVTAAPETMLLPPVLDSISRLRCRWSRSSFFFKVASLIGDQETETRDCGAGGLQAIVDALMCTLRPVAYVIIFTTFTFIVFA